MGGQHMATEAQAAGTFRLAHEFYKGGEKSTNKSYYGTGKTTNWLSQHVINLEEGADPTQKQQGRNAQTLRNMDAARADARSYQINAGKTPYEIGATLYLQQNTRGNCGEMAAVAMYLAYAGAHVPADEITLWTLMRKVKGGFFSKDRSFGHSFAVLGNGEAGESWAVDPWANFYCRVSEFSVTLTRKLEYWTRIGKRIAAEMPEGPCWVEPTNEMITAILGEIVIFDKVGLNEKGR